MSTHDDNTRYGPINIGYFHVTLRQDLGLLRIESPSSMPLELSMVQTRNLLTTLYKWHDIIVLLASKEEREHR